MGKVEGRRDKFKFLGMWGEVAEFRGRESELSESIGSNFDSADVKQCHGLFT
jgi:hypothetical protein